jgi:hypothetical protein
LITIYNSKFVLETGHKLNNGNIVFAGNQNLVSFNPAHFKTKKSPPDVSVTGIALFNDYLPVDSLLNLDKIKLAHNENSITIKFASLSFTQIHKLTYYYMLEGADKDGYKPNNCRPITPYYHQAITHFWCVRKTKKACFRITSRNCVSSLRHPSGSPSGFIYCWRWQWQACCITCITCEYNDYCM